MKPKTMILMGLAIVCGLGASYMTSRLLADRKVEEPEKIEIVVAKRSLSFGERISKPEEMFEMKAVTKESEPPDAIRDVNALKGKIIKQGRNRGDHITPANLYEKDGIEIPDGHQLVGLPVNLQTTAHGLATLPGSRVDLILRRRGPDDKTSFAKVILENVLVVAADGRVSREGEIIAPAQVVTFALTDTDRLKVNVAQDMGILSLSLRKLNDQKKTKHSVLTAEELLAGGQDNDVKPAAPSVPTPPPVVVAQAPKVEPKPEPKQIVEEPAKTSLYSTLIINGGQVQTITGQFNEDGEQIDGEPSIPRGSAVRGIPKKKTEPSDQ